MTQFQPANTITLFDAAHGVLMREACIFSARLSASVAHGSHPEPEPDPTAAWEPCFPRAPGCWAPSAHKLPSSWSRKT